MFVDAIMLLYWEQFRTSNTIFQEAVSADWLVRVRICPQRGGPRRRKLRLGGRDRVLIRGKLVNAYWPYRRDWPCGD